MKSVHVPVLTVEIANHNIIHVSAGKAGEGKDLRTVVRIVNTSCTQMWVGVNGQASVEADSFTLSFRGEAELETFLEALEFMKHQLKAAQTIEVP